MLTKDYIRRKAKFNAEDEDFILSVYSQVFDKEVSLRIVPVRSTKADEEDGVTDRVVEICNDLINLGSSNLVLVKEAVWKYFNRYGKLVSYTLDADTVRFEKQEITKDEYASLNVRRQRDLFETHSMQDCWGLIGEPEYRTCLSPELWDHRFGFITYYPEWEEDGLNILVRNGEIFGYANGLNPIVKEFDNPELRSVYELWR